MGREVKGFTGGKQQFFSLVIDAFLDPYFLVIVSSQGAEFNISLTKRYRSTQERNKISIHHSNRNFMLNTKIEVVKKKSWSISHNPLVSALPHIEISQFFWFYRVQKSHYNFWFRDCICMKFGAINPLLVLIKIGKK